MDDFKYILTLICKETLVKYYMIYKNALSDPNPLHLFSESNYFIVYQRKVTYFETRFNLRSSNLY